MGDIHVVQTFHSYVVPRPFQLKLRVAAELNEPPDLNSNGNFKELQNPCDFGLLISKEGAQERRQNQNYIRFKVHKGLHEPSERRGGLLSVSSDQASGFWEGRQHAFRRSRRCI